MATANRMGAAASRRDSNADSPQCRSTYRSAHTIELILLWTMSAGAC